VAEHVIREVDYGFAGANTGQLFACLSEEDATNVQRVMLILRKFQDVRLSKVVYDDLFWKVDTLKSRDIVESDKTNVVHMSHRFE